MNKPEKKKLPNHLQFDTVSPATKLLEKRRKMYEVHEAFEAQKDEFKKQEEVFKRQEEQIRYRDMQIQEDLIKFCKFLQDNEAKKNRAEKRLIDEQKAREFKEKEIGELRTQCQDLQKHQQKLEKKVTALKKYEDYLDSIIKTYPDQYPDLGEILNRYKTLTSSNENLVKEHRAMEKEYERLKYESTQYEKEKNHEILQLNNDLKELTKQLEEKTNERNQLQGMVESFNNDASSKNLNLGRILMAIDNQYNRCQEGTQKIKHDYEENRTDKVNKDDKKQKEKEKEKEKKKNQKDKKDEQQVNDEDNYEAKSSQKYNMFQNLGLVAASKLKSIALYMNDFKKIIDACRTEINKAKESQKKQ